MIGFTLFAGRSRFVAQGVARGLKVSTRRYGALLDHEQVEYHRRAADDRNAVERTMPCYFKSGICRI